MKMRTKMNTMRRAVLVALAVAACATVTPAADLTPAQARAIAVEAYVYTYPLAMMDATRRLMTNVPPGVKPGLGPANAFHHFRAYPTADFREVVRPNFDTLYSSAWLDLTKQPMVISIPDSGGRYYLAPLMDMWTDAYAVPGKRTSGTAAASYAVVPPGWSGTLPAGVERIDSPTVYNWLIGRTQTNGTADYAAVHAFQDGFKITPLSQWGKPAAAPAPFVSDPTVDMKTTPPNQVDGMTGDKYFAYVAELMKLHEPHATDWSTVARLKRLGIVPGQSFDIGKADPVVRQALLDAPKAAQALIKQTTPTIAKVVNGWQMHTDTMGVYGNSYLKRAVIAVIGLGANQVDDAIYPMNVADADGKPMDGNNDYVLHFSKAELPPVDAFWSITMYDGAGYQAANSLNRFAIGDRDALKYNADGSLDIYMQNASPGADKEANWLPAPKGPLGITMRLYAPRPEVADGRWVPPAIKRVK
jgi:hypothetical protein